MNETTMDPIQFATNEVINLLRALQCLPKTWIYPTPYVCTERIFDSRPFIHKKMFLKKVLKNLIAHIFTLLLTPFTSKLVKYSRHSESFEKCLKTVKSLFSKENDVDFEFFRKFEISLCLDKLTNLDAKGAKRGVKMWASNF